jgi:hypothetical protein
MNEKISSWDAPHVGDEMTNGATIIAYHRIDARQGFVLAYALKGVNGYEYVTWRYVLDDYCNLVCHSGRYFGSIMAAAKDFARRSGTYFETCFNCGHESADAGNCACWGI